MKQLTFLFTFFIALACKKDSPPQDNTPPPSDPSGTSAYYFPETSSNNWETVNMQDLNWNTSDTSELYDFLSQNGTRAFIILHKGKIVIEKYWGNNIMNSAPFNQSTQWYWASAGKTITSFLVGLAQEEGLLNINDKTSDYLGNNWTSLSPDKEGLITLKHQLTMTTGLDYNASDQDCTTPSCLQYKTDAGDQWYYHNAPYTLLKSVVINASGMLYNDFTDQKLESKIGMNGKWMQLGDNNVYLSSARDAARFGLLLLNKGKWANNQIMTDINYFNAMTNSSQNLNPAYGYLFWLNGKSSIILPGSTISFNQQFSNNAPADLFSGIGKNGQYVNVIPSRDMVIIRMGDAPDTSPVPTVFHDAMWEKINQVIN
jgi:CubicO group peptidase (beta-lactamase class C family)